MAGKYSKQELKSLLHESTFKIVMQEGIEHCTVRRVSSGCGLSDPYIYQCYSDLQDLMTSAFLEIDKEVGELMFKIINENVKDVVFKKDGVKAAQLLWSAYWDFLMEKPEKTVFYWRFYQSAYYTLELHEERQKNYKYFKTFVGKAGKNLGVSEKADIDILISNIIDNTVSVAVKIHLGMFKDSDIAAQTVFHSVFALLFHYMGLNVWDYNFKLDEAEQ